MIDWSKYSLSEIVERWEEFQVDRLAMTSGSNKTQKSHITVQDREKLIDHLIERLENAKSCMEN